MYDKLAQFGRTLVGVTAVPKQQFGEIRKLVDGEVGGQRGLLAFLAYNSDTWANVSASTHFRLIASSQELTNIGSLDHADIIATITYTAYSLLGEFSDQPGDIRLLRWAASTGHHDRKLSRQ